MKTVIGVLMVMVGIALGIWAGLVWAFVGGIIDIVNEVKATDPDAMNVAFGVVKIVFAGLIGWVSALALILPGLAIAGATARRRVRPY